MSSFCLGYGLSLKQRWVGAHAPTPTPTPTPSPSAIESLDVLGATVLPDGADAAIPNGWVAVATLPDDGVSAFDPTKISLTVSDPGFDISGNATTVERTITGTEIIRRQYPNQAQRLNSASGGVRTVYFALSGEVYAGSTITAADASSGYYGGAEPGEIEGISNGSTLAYPRPLFGWLNLQHERATGASLNVEAVAYHRHARNGQQVAAIRFTARDAAGNADGAGAQTASAPALSSFQTQGPIVEAWKATLSLAAMPQGDLCQVNAIVYPWIGDASAVLDTSDTSKGAVGTVTPGTNVNTGQGETPLRFLCDKTGGYGGLEAWVKAGAGTGTVGSSATPYATIQAALAALATANNSTKGHSDHSGSTIWLLGDGAGGAVDHTLGATNATAAGKCWTDIRVDPGATGQVRIAFTTTVQVSSADLLRFCCPIYVNASGNAGLDGGVTAGGRRVALDGATMTGGGTNPATPFTYRYGMAFWRNVTFTNFRGPFFPFSTERTCAALVLGCVGNIVTESRTAPYTFVGNQLSNVRIVENQSTNANVYSQDGAILANNILLKVPNSCAIGEARDLDRFARVQNVFETASTMSASAPAWRIGGDGQSSAIGNFISMHNTVPGVGALGSNQARQNACYTDVASAAGVQKQMVEKYDLLHQRNCKTDTFTNNTTVTGRTGNWRYRYGVGNAGVVVVTGDANGGGVGDPSGGNWTGEYVEPDSDLSAGEANVIYVDNKAGASGAGGGDYHLANIGGGTHAARGRVPAGRGVLKYDLAGVLRKQDGAGAAGAYERTDV